MTLVVAARTDDGVWMGADRISSGSGGHYHEMVGPKIYPLYGEGVDALVGFAGSARVAQAILRLEPPPRAGDAGPEEWLTRWADTVHDRCAQLDLLKQAGDESEMYLASYTAMVIAVDGRVFFMGDNLHWTEPAAGWSATGSGAEVFAGAYEVLRERHNPVTAARYAWPYVQRHYMVGDLVDELHLPAA